MESMRRSRRTPTNLENPKEYLKLAKKNETPLRQISAYFLTRLDGKADLLNPRDGKKLSLLDYAASNGNLNLVIWLILNNADPAETNSTGNTPLHRAVMHERHLVAQFFLMFVVLTDLKNKYNKTAFKYTKGELEKIKTLTTTIE